VKNNRGDQMMTMIKLEEIAAEKISIAQEIVLSNKTYNVLENGREIRTIDEIKEEFLNPDTKSYFIKVDESYIGLIDYLEENPKDHYPWLGLLMIHESYKGKGFGKKAYLQFEQQLIQEGKQAVRLGVLTQNTHARNFWESLGFIWYETKPFKEGREVDCYEKKLEKS
jgi:GNAT superfamily N-acetyltransferase